MSPKDPKKAKKIEVQSNEISVQMKDDLEREIARLREDNETLKSAQEEQQKKILRLHADIDNLHKQHALEVGQARKSGKKTLIMPVIDLLNTINLSFAFVPPDVDERFQKFVESLRASLIKAQGDLDSIGITLLMPNVGDTFNPERMQALNSSQDATVKQVVNIGYMIDGVVISPAIVMI